MDLLWFLIRHTLGLAFVPSWSNIICVIIEFITIAIGHLNVFFPGDTAKGRGYGCHIPCFQHVPLPPPFEFRCSSGIGDLYYNYMTMALLNVPWLPLASHSLLVSNK